MEGPRERLSGSRLVCVLFPEPLDYTTFRFPITSSVEGPGAQLGDSDSATLEESLNVASEAPNPWSEPVDLGKKGSSKSEEKMGAGDSPTPTGPRVLKPNEEAQPVGELALLLRRSSVLVEQIRKEGSRALLRAQEQQERLQSELEASRAEADSLAEMMAKLERRSTQLTRLYVATFQLYLGRTPDQVYDTIAEITTDILGAERYALLMRDGDGEVHRVVLRHGIEEGAGAFGGEVYEGGHVEVDEALDSGRRWVQADPGGLVAVVPLQVDETILGALVIVGLLEHKPRLEDSDSEVLDLLGAHAASALLSSMNLSIAARKLQTMTSLFRLVIGDAGDPPEL